MPRALLAAILLVVVAVLACRKWDNPYEKNRPPLPPSTPTPDSGAVGLDSGFVLSWTCTDPDSTDTLSYILYFGNRPEPPLAESGLSQPVWRPSGLAWRQQYWWRVTAVDNWQGRTDGPLWTFTMAAENHAPLVPHSPTPESGASELGVRLVLGWTAEDPDSLDSLQFDVLLGTTTPLPVVATGLRQPQFAPSGLAYGRVYLWQVVVRDNRGAETRGPVWRFATMPALVIDAPQSGERIRMLADYLIRYSGGPAVSRRDSTVVYYTLNGTNWIRLGQPLVNGQYQWSVPGQTTATAGVQVRAFLPGDTVVGTATNVTIYDTLRPSAITVTVPNALSRWNVGQTYTVRWTGGTDGMDSAVVFYSADSGQTWRRQGSTKQVNQYQWTPAGPGSNKARVRVVAWCRNDSAQGTSVVFNLIEPPYPDSVIGQIAVGSQPAALCFDSLDNRVFCALRGESTVVVISGSSNAIIQRITVGRAPALLLWNPAGNKVYCATDSGRLAVIGGSSGAIQRVLTVGRRPAALCLDPVRNRLWVANGGDSSLTVIDCAGDSVLATVIVGRLPRFLVYNRSADRICATDSVPGRLNVVNPDLNVVVAAVPLTPVPFELTVDEANNIIWAAGRGANMVMPVDGASNQALAPVVVGREPWCPVWNGARERVYVLNSADNNIAVLDASTRRVALGIPVAAQPRTALLVRQTGKLYVANQGAGSLALIDCVEERVLRFINVGAKPVALCYNSVSNKLYSANLDAGTVTVLAPRAAR